MNEVQNKGLKETITPRRDLVEVVVDLPVELVASIERRGLSVPDVLREIGRELIETELGARLRTGA
jgi:hypothetical protein